ncbi:MAG TPA: F0F1 ATP synthase subunit B [Anaerolineaceae bacterium]|nr:F0F1 ATP synthase subunit B [Anaerolineaceae bacterium]HRS74130.1 F0F1 ATP synthase subunit B [Anaerolineaceae bacterium]
MEKLGLNLGFLIVQIINFLVILVVLREWVYTPLQNSLKKRRETIEKGLEDARVAAEARENAERDAAGILAEAQNNAAQLIREAKEKAELAGREVKASVEADIAKTRREAAVEVERERERVLGEIRTNVAALAIAAAQKLVGEALDEKRQHELVAEFFSGIKGGKVTILEENELKGKNAEVVSALPLTRDEQKVIQGEMLSKLGETAAVSFNVDPKLLGGLVVRVGDTVIDGSVAGQIQSLRATLE